MANSWAGERNRQGRWEERINRGERGEGGERKGGEEVTRGQPLSLTTRLEIKREETHLE